MGPPACGISPTSGFHHPISFCLWPSYLRLLGIFETILQLCSQGNFPSGAPQSHLQWTLHHLRHRVHRFLRRRQGSLWEAIIPPHNDKLTMSSCLVAIFYVIMYRILFTLPWTSCKFLKGRYQSFHVCQYLPTSLCDMLKVQECWWWPCRKASWFKQF